MRIKEAVEEYLFCGALIDKSPDRVISEEVNENLEDELGPEPSVLVPKQNDLR